MVACSIPTPTIPNIFKYKLYKSLPTNGLPALPVVILTPEDVFSLAAIPSHAVADRPLELGLAQESLKDTDQDHLALALETLIDNSATSNEDAPWMHKLIPELEKLAAQYHLGNYVLIRATGKKIFESMPIYARIGMHLLFYGKPQVLLLGTETQGKIYDSPESAESIHSFVKTYSLSLTELLEPDICKYPTFNAFFARKLRPDARPVKNIDDPVGICSAADCRLAVYQTFDLAREFWVKGLAIFRLAPQDYHRFHCPIDGTIDGEPTLVSGQYYTVNPQAINQPSFDVLTANKMAFIAVGALLVGSIVWTFGGEDRKGDAKGITVKRGEELGCFKYGGSTIVALFEKGLLEFDADLVKTSQDILETLVQVGESIGTSVKESCHDHH
ncbi:phosphatidylserine decarboxylase-domain-containing protein [Mucidula mucida]|nr:phosphatidylserine decarboxylase-domain-containing protein [Mucidula mucida]